MEASWHGDTQQSSRCWRQHTFLILTSLVREPSRWLAFFSIHLMRLLTPPSESDEALLFSQPVIWRSTNPPLGAVGRASFIDTSPAAAFLRMALLALSLSIPALPPLPPLGGRSRLFGGGVDFPIPPRPFTAMSIFTSPSRSALRIPPRPRRFAAGPRGAFRGLWLRAPMAAAGMFGEALSGGSDVDTAMVVGGVQFLPVPEWGCRGGRWLRSVGCLLASGKLFVQRGWFK